MKTKVTRFLCAVLCIGMILSFGGCKISFTGENNKNQGKKEINPNIPTAAQGIYGALGNGIGNFTDKFKGVRAGMPVSDIGTEPFKLTYDFSGDFNVPSLGSNYGALLKGLTLKGDITSNLSDVDINATIGLAAANGTLSANAFYDDATGLYFTIPGYMTDYLFVPPESLGAIGGGQSSAAAEELKQLDPAIITNFTSALSALIYEYADSIFTYIPASAYADSKVSFTPLGSSQSVNVTETAVTLTPANLTAVVKGIAGELSKDTTLFPAFVDALLDIMAVGSEMNGESFDRSATQSQIYSSIANMAAAGGDISEFDKLEIKAYYTDEQFYEFDFTYADSSGTFTLTVSEAPDTGLCKLVMCEVSGTPGSDDYFNFSMEANIGGEAKYEGMTPVNFIAQVNDGSETYQLSADMNFAVTDNKTDLRGEITFTGDSVYAELAFASSSEKTAEGASFDLDVSSLKFSENQTELVSGSFRLSGTYSKLAAAEASAMAPDFANVVDINTVDETYMGNLMEDLYTNPVVATVLQIIMTVEQ